MRYLALLLFLFASLVSKGQTEEQRKYLVSRKLVTQEQVDTFTTRISRNYDRSIEAIKSDSELSDSLKKADIRSIEEHKTNPAAAFSNVVGWNVEDTLYLIKTILDVTDMLQNDFASDPGTSYVWEKYTTPLDTNNFNIAAILSFCSQLKEQNLISEYSEKELIKSVRKGIVTDSIRLLVKAIDLKKRETSLNHLQVKYYLDQIDEVGALKKWVKLKLIQKAYNYDLYVADLVAALDKGLVIDFRDYPKKLQQSLPLIYQKISQLLPELTFNNLKIQIDSIDYYGSKDYFLKVELDNNGRHYSIREWFLPDGYDEDGHLNVGTGYQEPITAIFNKILRDRQSRYRLFSLASNIPDESGVLFLAALTEIQFPFFSYSSLLQASPFEFKKGITSSGIDSAISLYQKLGLFKGLSAKTIDSSRRVVAQTTIDNYSDILMCFPNQIFETDMEYGTETAQYADITRQLAAISRGGFKPTKLVDGYTIKNYKQFKYGFTLGSKAYLTTLTQEDDWLDPGFWLLIEKAIEEQDKTGRFYHLSPSDGMKVIYLNHKQAAELKRTGKLNFYEAE